MGVIASSRQLRFAFARWALFLVPGVMLLGFLSGQVAGSGADNAWFAALAKPGIYPPPVVFPVVWSVLYAMMGLALAGVVAARGARGRGWAVAVFVLQLVLNLAWSPLFFAAHRIMWSLGLIAGLDLVLLVTVVLFFRVRVLSGVLLLPYLGWVLFASALTWQFWVLNPAADGRVDEAVPVLRLQIAH